MYSGVIIKHEDRCLLCKRSEKYTHPNQWFIPAGQIETGESPRECAIRELYEETNLEFTESDLHFVGTIPTMDDEGGLTNDFIYLFICEIDHQMVPDLENAQDVVVEVYDLLGRSVYTKSMANVSAGGVIVELDEANFNAKSSAYIVRVKLAEGYITAQIIKN